MKLFFKGLIGGTVWNTFGGFRNAPRGQGFRQAVARVKARAPITGGSFAIWGVLFACFDCSISHLRKKEDLWNPILSGAATGGLLAARSGLKNMGKNAVIGGVILAAIEGMGVVISRYVVPMFERNQMNAAAPVDLLEPPFDPSRKSAWKGSISTSINDDIFFQPTVPMEITTNNFDKATVTDDKKNKSSWSLW